MAVGKKAAGKKKRKSTKQLAQQQGANKQQNQQVGQQGQVQQQHNHHQHDHEHVHDHQHVKDHQLQQRKQQLQQQENPNQDYKKRMEVQENDDLCELEDICCRLPISARFLSFMDIPDRVRLYATNRFFRYRILPTFRPQQHQRRHQQRNQALLQQQKGKNGEQQAHSHDHNHGHGHSHSHGHNHSHSHNHNHQHDHHQHGHNQKQQQEKQNNQRQNKQPQHEEQDGDDGQLAVRKRNAVLSKQEALAIRRRKAAEERRKLHEQVQTLNFVPVKNGQKDGEEKEEGEGKKKLYLTQQMVHHMGRVDHHMLLDRLNTRRLFKRLVYYKKNNIPGRPFPKDMTTFEIACMEWDRCIEQWIDPPVPPSLELALFSSCPRAVTILASYPRSGNTLMRTMYERCTMRVSGSDMHGGLQKHDVVGEAVIGTNEVQFVKTHYPERLGISPFPTSKVVLLVRNPYDALESYFNLMMTGAHTDNVKGDMRKKYQHVWEEMVLKEVDVWKKFHEFWLSQKIPILLVKYEDLTRYPKQVMSRVLQFSLNVKDMGFYNRRIDRCFGDESIEKLGSYRPRSGGIGKSLSKYSPELLQKMNVGIVEIMKRLGYEEMLVPDSSSWKLQNLVDYAVENKSTPGIVVVNGAKLVRGPEHRTNWRQIERTCDCANCKKRREEREKKEKDSNENAPEGDDEEEDVPAIPDMEELSESEGEEEMEDAKKQTKENGSGSEKEPDPEDIRMKGDNMKDKQSGREEQISPKEETGKGVTREEVEKREELDLNVTVMKNEQGRVEKEETEGGNDKNSSLSDVRERTEEESLTAEVVEKIADAITEGEREKEWGNEMENRVEKAVEEGKGQEGGEMKEGREEEKANCGQNANAIYGEEARESIAIDMGVMDSVEAREEIRELGADGINSTGEEEVREETKELGAYHTNHASGEEVREGAALVTGDDAKELEREKTTLVKEENEKKKTIAKEQEQMDSLLNKFAAWIS